MKLITTSPVVDIVEVTPVLASQILKLNTHNRRINPTRVDAIVQDINANRFHTTGAGVTISRSGVLLDGQHRLLAVVQAGKSVTMAVMTGAEDDAQLFMDQVQGRSFGQQLGLTGLKNSGRIATITKAIAGFVGRTYGTYKSNGELESWRQLYNDDIDSILKIVGTTTRSEIVAALVVASTVHGFKAKSEEFARKLADRQFNGRGDPVGNIYTRAINVTGHDQLLDRTLNALVHFSNGTTQMRTDTNSDVSDFFRERAPKV